MAAAGGEISAIAAVKAFTGTTGFAARTAAWSAAGRTTTPVTAATTAALFTGLGFVDFEITAVKFLLVQGINRCLCSGIIHFDKTKSAEPFGITVSNHGDVGDFAVFFKQAAHL